MGVRRGREEGPKESLCLSFCMGEEEEEEVNKPLSCTWPEVRCVGGECDIERVSSWRWKTDRKKELCTTTASVLFCEKFYNFQRLS